MAIITKYTFGKLCSELDIDLSVTRQNFRDKVFSDDQVFFIFNSRENKYLFIYASMLADEESFKMEYYQHVPEKEDHHIYVNERPGKANYHLYNDCPMVLKDFEDFYIPLSLRTLNDDAINEYRTWFRSHDFARRYDYNEITLQDIVNEFNNKYPDKYGIEPLAENHNLYHKVPNSGRSTIDEKFDLNEFEIDLENLKIQFDEEFTSHEWRKFSKFTGLRKEDPETIYSVLDKNFPEANIRLRFSIEELIAKLNKASYLKQRMISSLIKYLRWHHHFEAKEFDQATLEDFGLKCCRFCEKKKEQGG